MSCNKILTETEDWCNTINEERARAVINEFLQITRLKISFNPDDDQLKRLLLLKNKLGYNQVYRNLFFNILLKHGYNPKSEIIDAFNKLGRPKTPKQNYDLIQRLIRSPYIEDISFDGEGQFKIISPQYGIINFTLASYEFKNDSYLSNYIQNNRLIGRCHNHTIFLRAIFPAYHAITSLCPAYFGGKYHHSYTYDSNTNSIIDLCSNAIINKDDYDFIYEPDEISVVLNSNITAELKETKRKSNQPDERFALLKIALYKQHLTEKARKKDPNTPKVLSLIKEK